VRFIKKVYNGIIDVLRNVLSVIQRFYKPLPPTNVNAVGASTRFGGYY
jgi:hypothetical protein